MFFLLHYPGAGSSPKKNMCTHPGIIGGMCIRCGQIIDDESGVSRVAFGYIHKVTFLKFIIFSIVVINIHL